MGRSTLDANPEVRPLLWDIQRHRVRRVEVGPQNSSSNSVGRYIENTNPSGQKSDMDIWVLVVLNENMFVCYFPEILFFYFTLMMLTFDCAMEFITIQLRNMPFQSFSNMFKLHGPKKTPRVVETIEGKLIVVVTNPWYT